MISAINFNSTEPAGSVLCLHVRLPSRFLQGREPRRKLVIKLAWTLGGAPMRIFLALLATGSMMLVGCVSLSETECLKSPDHTLVQPDGELHYECKAARNDCEKGFVQMEQGPAECNVKTSCEFVPGECYCPPDLQCFCGGGPPGSCRSKL